MPIAISHRNLSPYAVPLPVEDFAETFAIFVRRRGEMQPHIDTAPPRRTWGASCANPAAPCGRAGGGSSRPWRSRLNRRWRGSAGFRRAMGV